MFTDQKLPLLLLYGKQSSQELHRGWPHVQVSPSTFLVCSLLGTQPVSRLQSSISSLFVDDFANFLRIFFCRTCAAVQYTRHLQPKLQEVSKHKASTIFYVLPVELSRNIFSAFIYLQCIFSEFAANKVNRPLQNRIWYFTRTKMKVISEGGRRW